MPNKPSPRPPCPNVSCSLVGKIGAGNVTLDSFSKLRRGSRRRFRCNSCGRRFVSTVNTPYHRLKCTQAEFDQVARMSVEGIGISQIARSTQRSWNTIARWLERAGEAARSFNDATTRGFDLQELQADEIRTFAPEKDKELWVFADIEVASRLWPSHVVGRRSAKNTRTLFEDTQNRGETQDLLLVSTDGFECFPPAVRKIFGSLAIHGQVIKTYRGRKIGKIERTVLQGSEDQFWEAISRSEDSETINTSFIERLNLTIRQGTAYLNRRSPCHARLPEYLDRHLHLLRAHYNFVRPHRALKYGPETWTPAMQAGITSRRLSLREIFTAGARLSLRTRIRSRITILSLSQIRHSFAA